MPRISVVIPTYDSEAFLAETLESVRQQTCRDFEVVLVDDGSRDGTLRVAQSFAASFELRILQQVNSGPASARNAGVRAARGQYCAFIDADDLMLPERLAQQQSLLDAHPELCLVHTDLMTFDDSGILHRTRRAFSNPCGGRILDRLLVDNFITTSTVMASTQRLIEAGLFNERRRVSEDFELWLKMAELWPIGYLEQPLVQYRVRPGSLSNDKLVTGQAALEVIEAFWSAHAQYAELHPEVRRRSLAGHLAFVGGAAVRGGRPAAALGWLLRALRHEPRNPTVWRQLGKLILGPLRSRVPGRASGPSKAAGVS